MPDCPSCGAENRPQASFCMFCGTSLRSSVSHAAYDASTIPSATAGTLLGGRYEIEELISTGGMGFVYRAHDRLSGKLVAIKEMIDRFTTREERKEAIERFNREADMLCKLSHSSIPQFIEYFVENKRYYLVMNHIQGQDLASTMKSISSQSSGPHSLLPIQNVVRWSVNICEVLDYLHSQDPPVIYRDLKPSNLIVKTDGNLMLIDFGIARLFTPKVKATMVGTQGYAPPEQYRGESEPRSDLYSLGATMHHLLTGKDPQYEAPFHFEAIRKLNPKVPVSLEKIVDRALRLIPADRFQTAKEFKLALTCMIAAEEEFASLDNEIRDIVDEITGLKIRKNQFLLPEEYERYQKEGDISLQEEQPKEQKLPDWRHYGGNPQRTGLSRVPSYPRGTLQWKRNIGEQIHASPVIDNKNNIYVGTINGNYFCLSDQGEIEWEYDAGDSIVASSCLDIRYNSYFFTKEGVLIKLNSEGEIQWSSFTGESVGTAPLVYKGMVYWGDIEGFFHCCTDGGANRWIFDTTSPIYSSATLDSSGKSIYLSNYKGSLIALNKNGEQEWKRNLSGTAKASCPISSNGIIYAGCEDGNLHAIGQYGEKLWRFKTGGPIRSAPAIGKDGSIYVPSTNGFLYALDEKGMEKWKFNAEDEIISSPVVSDDGTVFFVSEDGFLFSINSWGKSRWWFDLGERVIASPVITPHGRICVCTEKGYVHSIE